MDRKSSRKQLSTEWNTKEHKTQVSDILGKKLTNSEYEMIKMLIGKK
jgi:hypothetical protein